MSVINIVARLSARAIVHVQNQMQAVFAAPFYGLVHHAESLSFIVLAHIIFACEEFVVERQADGVGTCACDVGDIILGDIMVLESLPERSGEIRTSQLADHSVDHPLAVGFLEVEHIAFRIEPVAQVGTYDVEFAAIWLYKILALHDDVIATGRDEFLNLFFTFFLPPVAAKEVWLPMHSSNDSDKIR